VKFQNLFLALVRKVIRNAQWPNGWVKHFIASVLRHSMSCMLGESVPRGPAPHPHPTPTPSPTTFTEEAHSVRSALPSTPPPLADRSGAPAPQIIFGSPSHQSLRSSALGVVDFRRWYARVDFGGPGRPGARRGCPPNRAGRGRRQRRRPRDGDAQCGVDGGLHGADPARQLLGPGQAPGCVQRREGGVQLGRRKG